MELLPMLLNGFFMKLEGKTVIIDKKRYFLNDLPTQLGILQHIINQTKTA
jgi:hypothetical protein